MPEEILKNLQETIDSEIPMCAKMGMRVQSFGEQGLTIQAPLDPNRNHQYTAFAGSLNALCTMSGWAMVYLILHQHALRGNIVIRRSAIKYLQPVESADIVARCRTPSEKDKEHFLDMLREKGQSKIDLRAEIEQGSETVVSFHGSYVVLDGKSSAD